MPFDLLSHLQEEDPTTAPTSLVNQNAVKPEFNLLGAITGDDSAPPAPSTPKTWGSEFTTAFSRGTHELEQMGYGAGALVSSWLDAPKARDWFLQGYNAQTQLIQQEPETVGSIQGVDSFDKAIRYGLSTAGGFGPIAIQNIATALIGSAVGTAAEPGAGTIAGGVTGLVARKAVSGLLESQVKSMIGEAGTKELGEYLAGNLTKDALSPAIQKALETQGVSVAKKMGADAFVGLANVGIMTGSLYGDLSTSTGAQDIPESDKRWAATVGGFLAAIPMTGVSHLIASKFLPGVAVEAIENNPAIKDQLASNAGYTTRFMMTAGKEILKNAPEMSAAMFTQTAITLAAKNWADPSTRWDFLHFTPGQWQEMIDSAAKGGIIGGITGVGVGGITAFPDPNVRSKMKTVLQGADDVPLNVDPASPLHQELEKVNDHIDNLNTAIGSGNLSDDELADAHGDLISHQQRATDLTNQLGLNNPNVETKSESSENTPLVNQKTEVSEPTETAKPTVSAPTTDSEKIESLRAFYAQEMPSRTSTEEAIPDLGEKAADKQKEVNDHIDSIAGDTPHGKALKEAITPDIVNMMAAENVTLDTDPRANEEPGKLGYAAKIANDGVIKMYVPDIDSANPNEDVKASVAHEVAHVADLISLRKEWEDGGKQGKVGDFVNQRWQERGESAIAAEPLLPKTLKAAYDNGKLGELTPIQIGQELPRMATEMARTGTLSEATDALTRLAKGNNVLNAFSRNWLDAIKSVGQTIKNFLNPQTTNPELLKAYDGINQVLDKYGVLVNQKPEAKEPTVAQPEPPTPKPVAHTPPLEPTPKTEPLPSQVAPAKEKTTKQIARSNFLKSIKEKGPSDVARSYLDWKEARGETPITKAEINAAHLDLVQRAPNIKMDRDRFTALAKQKLREKTNTTPTKSTATENKTPGDTGASGSQLAKKAAFANEQQPLRSNRDVQSDERSEDGYHSKIVASIAEKTKESPSGSKLTAIRDHLAEHHPELLPHFQNIVKELQSTNDPAAAERWMQNQIPIRGPEAAEHVRANEYEFFSGSNNLQALTEQLAKERGLKALGGTEETGRDAYIMDASSLLEFHEDTVPGVSVIAPVEITNKLLEAQATRGIPETHDIQAFGHDTITPELTAKLDEHFGKNNWILKNYGPEAMQCQGVMFPESVAELLQGNPKAFEPYDTSKMMAQEMHDIPDKSVHGFVQPGQELRVHVVTDQDGNAHILPFSTFYKLTREEAMSSPVGERTPILVESDHILQAHEAALDAIHSLPESDRSGQMFGMDMIRTRGGEWKPIENNPSEPSAMSGYFADSALAHDSYMAGILGERPIHAELASVAHEAMKADEVDQPKESSLVNQSSDAVAQKPVLKAQDESDLERMLNRTNAEFDKTYSKDNLPDTKSEIRKRGNVGEYGHLDQAALEYRSQPQSEVMARAQRVISEEGLQNVMEHLQQEPLGMKYGLNDAEEMDGVPNAGTQALYKLVAMQVDANIGKLRALGSSWIRSAINWMQDTFSKLESNNMQYIRGAARAVAITHQVDKVWNAQNARRSFVEPIIAHLEKVLGKKGARFISNMTDALNNLMKDYTDRVVTRADVTSKLQKIAEASKTKKWQDAARKTAVDSDAKARRVVRNMAARAADYVAMDKAGSTYIDQAAQNITKRINGLQRADAPKTEPEIFKSVVQQVANDNARELGLIGDKVNNSPTLQDQFGAILKNEPLYNEFVNTLRQKMLNEYNPEPGSPFADQLDQFHNEMANRGWSQSMVDSLVNQKNRELETTFAKIAREHYGLSDFRAEYMKESVRQAMKDQGVENEGLLNKLMDDVEGSFRSSTEQARLDFFGSAQGPGEFLKHMQTTLAAKAKEHIMGQKYLPEDFASWLSNDYGIPDTKDMPLASTLAEVMRRQYNEMLGEKRVAIVNDMVAKATEGQSDAVKAKAMSATDKILQLVNLGVMSNEKAYTALAPKFGLPAYSEEIAKQAEALGEKIATAPNKRMADESLQDLSGLIASQKGIRPYDMFLAGLYTNMLSGFSTPVVHVTGNGTSFLGTLPVNALLYPQHIPAMLRQVFTSMTGSALTEAKEVFRTGKTLFRNGDRFFGNNNPMEMNDPVFKSNLKNALDVEGTRFEGLGQKAQDAAEAAASASHKIYKALGGKYVGRILGAADAFFYKLAQEASFAAKTGITENEEMRRSAMDQARQEMAQRGLNPDDSSALKLKQQVYANDIVNQMRLVNQKGELDENFRDAWVSAHNEAMDTTFKQDPKGILGSFAKMIETWARGKEGEGGNPFGKMLMPFTRISANVANQMLEWTPYGLVRWGAGHLYGDDFRLKNEKGEVLGRDPRVALRSLIGTTGAMGLMAMFSQYEDDKDPYLAIYSKGSSNPERRRQMMDMGWRPETIKVGSSYVSYKTTPFNMLFSIMGRMFDNHRDGHDNANGFASSAVAMLHSVTDESFLSGLTDFMSAVDSPDPAEKIGRLMSRMVTTPFIPNMVKQIDSWVDPSVQQAQGFTEQVLRQLPVVRHELKPSLNIFGEQITHDPAIDLPGMERFMTMEKTTDPVLNYLSESNVTVPGFSKGSKIGNQVMTRDQYYQYIQSAGPEIKQAIQAEIPQLQSMDKEHAQERVNEIVRQIKEKIRNSMRSGI